MGFFRPSRRFERPRRYAMIHTGVFIIGLGLVITGFIVGITWLVWFGLGILALNIFLRFLP